MLVPTRTRNSAAAKVRGAGMVISTGGHARGGGRARLVEVGGRGLEFGRRGRPLSMPGRRSGGPLVGRRVGKTPSW